MAGSDTHEHDQDDDWPRWDAAALAYAGDSPRTARFRKAQSRWRETVLHLPPGRSDRGTLVGNMLRPDAPADAQWLTTEIADFTRARLAVTGDASLNTSRLQRNLLSSMPLCFNVMGELSAHRPAAARVLSAVLE